jgi:hypothetical protein
VPANPRQPRDRWGRFGHTQHDEAQIDLSLPNGHYEVYGYDVAMSEARDFLLDALVVLGPHREALIVVGAQAVYEHTRQVSGLEQSSTNDGDLAVDPGLVTPSKSIYQAMLDAGFFPARPERSGIYSRRPTPPNGKPLPPTLDLIAPESVSGSSRSHRGARIVGQDKRAVSKADGLEMALLDYEWRRIGPIATNSGRPLIEAKVAGTAALLCAKAWKLYEQVRDAEVGKLWRLREKDAGDIWRLMYVSNPAEVREAFDRYQQHPLLGAAIRSGKGYLGDLFGPAGRGRLLAAKNLLNGRTEVEVVNLVDEWMSKFSN